MNFDSLANDAKKLFCTLYKAYLEKIKNGVGLDKASIMGNSSFIQSEYFPKYSQETICNLCLQLHSNGFLQCTFASNIVYHSTLTDDSIAFMQHRFQKGVKEVINFITDLI